MAYDFTSIIDRRGTHAKAVENNPIAGSRTREGFDPIPMWVADMGFATCPAITRRLAERIAHPLFGYFNMPDDYFDAIIQWQRRRFGVERLDRDSIIYQNGVIGAILSALAVLCSPGDAVLLHAPAYTGFIESLTQAGYHPVFSELRRDADGVWRMDPSDMDRLCRTHRIHTAIFCSPHNPTGRVWERGEIEEAMNVFARNDVTVLSDEIWADVTLDANQHIPTQSVNDDAARRTVAFYAPTKTFNLAGIRGSYAIAYDRRLRDRIAREYYRGRFHEERNVFSVESLIGAYGNEGEQWLGALLDVLDGNVRYAVDMIRSRFDGVAVSVPQGTYMLLLDCSAWCASHGTTIDELQRRGVEVGVIWQDGREFRCPNGIRMNLAQPATLVREAFERLDRYVFNA